MAAFPGVHISDNGNFEELIKWRAMYENPFFNPGRRITEDDAIKSLEFARGGDRSNRRGARPCGPPRTPAVAKALGLRYNVDLHTSATSKVIETHVGPPRVADKGRSPIPGSEDAENKPPSQPVTRGSGVGQPNSASSRGSSRLPTPRPTRTLQRRPRTPAASRDQNPTAPITRSPAKQRKIPADRKESDSSLSNAEPDEESRPDLAKNSSSTGTVKRMDVWIHSSFTTVCRDDPTDPNSYYNTNYPLALHKIQRRRKSADSLQNLANLAANQPELSLSFFNTVPLRRLSTPVLSETKLEELIG